jgi:plastocyanin
MLRIAGSAVMAVVLSITGIFTSPALADTSHTWQVQAGSPPAFDGGGPRGAGNRFYPEAIAIHQGDSVKFALFGPHTVTYNRPPGPVFAVFRPGGSVLSNPGDRVNSGFAGGPPGASFTVTFASTLPAGSYKFICALHFGMTETVDVLPTGAALPKTDAEYGAIAQAEITRDLASLDRINAEATENFEDEDGNPKILVGAGNDRVSNLRFYPASVTVRVGHSITFLKTKDPTEPHTVTFGDAFDPNNPLAEFVASGGSRYDGTGIANSGWMSTRDQYNFFQLAGTPLPVALTKYRLKFTRVGDFPYICAIHDPVGMVGIVHVVP